MTVARTDDRPPTDDLRQNQTAVARTDDRRQNQTTVTRTRPSLEPDDRCQNQTTTVRTTSQQTPRTIQLIDRLIELEL